MTKLILRIVAAAGLLIGGQAIADPITIGAFPDGEDIPAELGGWTLDPYEINDSDGTKTDSFTTESGNTFQMDDTVEVMTPVWVDDPDGGTIFGVPGDMVTLTPENPIGAISFIISSAWENAGAWVSATWEDGNGNTGSLRNPESGYFDANMGDLDGVGVGIWAEPGACITSVTIEPPEWGFGSIRTADCVSVPEPGTLALLGLGLVGIGVTRRRNT